MDIFDGVHDVPYALGEMCVVWAKDLVSNAPWIAAIGATAGGVAHAWRRWLTPWLEHRRGLAVKLSLVMLLAALALSLYQALGQASMVDDAFISFRYARNLVEGNGLVFNIGEQVEGYTNFLWTMIIAGLLWVLPLDAPDIALVLCLLCMVANLGVVYRFGRTLNSGWGLRPYVPVAVLMLAASWAFTSFGTTGMETMLLSLLVNLGALFLLLRDDARGAALSGAMFVAAAMAHPDHALFLFAGGLVLLIEELRKWRQTGTWERAAVLRLTAYCASLPVVAVWLIWKLSYYGAILPNTFHAKSGDGWYLGQGLLYFCTFNLGSHFWLITVLFAIWLFRKTSRPGVFRLKLFTGISFLLFTAYMFKIGGDFMYGRFYLSLLPLCLLAAECEVYRRGSPARSPRRVAALFLVVCVALGATARDFHIIPPGRIFWHVADEGSFYRLTRAFPCEVNNANFRVGQFFGEVLTGRGITPTVCTSGIGMFGYNSRLPVLDLRGLTDYTVAHSQAEHRGRPGHEKYASREYMHERKVLFIRKRYHQEHRHIAGLELGKGMGRPWRILAYDPELMAEIREKAPEIRHVDFLVWLDRYIAELETRDSAQVRKDYKFFRKYYFDHHDDPAREQPIEDFLRRDEGASGS